MRILLLVDAYLPTAISAAKLMHDLACQFSAIPNCTVTLVTPTDRINKSIEITSTDGFDVIRIKTGRIKNIAKPLRAINELLLPYYLWKNGKQYFKQHKHDLIVYYSPTIFWAPLINRLKSLWHAKSYLIVRDIFPQWAIDTKLLTNKIIIYYFRQKEMELYNSADIIGVQSPNNLDYFKNKLWAKNFKLEVLYNWMRLDEVPIIARNYREKFNLKDKIVFVFGGNLGVAQDLDNIILLAEAVDKHKKLHFLLVGDGSEYKRIQKLIVSKKITNVTMHPSVSQNIYADMIAEFDIGLITLDKKLKTQNLPGKLLPYMYYCKPILASINPDNDLIELIKQHNIGFVSINGNFEQLISDTLTLANSQTLRTELGNNARQLLEKQFSAEKAAKQILTHMS